jgi:hypothetical protein
MATERTNDLVAFKRFIDEQLSNGGNELTLNEALLRWEHENQTRDAQKETQHSNQEGVKDRHAGESKSVDEMIEELRKKHRLTLPARTLQSNPEEWIKRLDEFVASQPIRPNKMDDSRESIYAGRGE